MTTPIQWLSSLFQQPQKLAAKPFDWSQTAHSVVQCAGSVRNNGAHIGWATLVGIDRAIIPYHLVNGACLQSFTVTFWDQCSFDHYKIVNIFANVAADFAVIQFAQGICDPNAFPGHHFPFPRIIGLAETNQELMLVHGNEAGQRVASIGKLFGCTDQSGNLCTTIKTILSSSGGSYFNRWGHLIAIHLARATGLCSNSNQERKALLLQDLWNENFMSPIPVCQPLSPPARPLACLPYVMDHDVCYTPEGRKPPVHETNIEFVPANKRLQKPALKGSCTELRFMGIPSIGDGPRGINFTFPGVNVNYLFTIDPHTCGSYIASNFKDAKNLYAQATVAFREVYQKTGKIPAEFEFKYDKARFKAQASFTVGAYTTHILHEG